MGERVFKLNTSTMGILSENNPRSVVIIPANAMITIVAGDTTGDGLLKIRYRNQELEMFAVDLRTRGERMLRQSA
jgi:hypothetical protein